MKVVIAHNRYAAARPSGENTVVEAEIAQLRAAGVEVIPFLRNSDEIRDLPLWEKAKLPISALYNGRAQRELAQVLLADRPDVLHVHNVYPLLSPWVIRTAHHHEVPVVHTVHNYRQVCASGLYFRDGHICQDCAGRRLGLPAVQHACYRDSRAQSAIMAAVLAAHRGTWRGIDRYIALTEAMADHLVAFGVPRARITVKPNAIPDPGAPPAPGDAGGFLFAARLNPEKGLGNLLQAWRMHPDGALGSLRIAGDGPQRRLAERAAAERSDVVYLGSLDKAEMRSAIRAAACVVVASTWHDVLPTIALEALAGGRPVLGTKLGGLPYLIGDAGWAVPPTPEGLAEGLAAAYAQISAGAGIETAARQRYERCFSPAALTAKLVEIYEEVSR